MSGVGRHQSIQWHIPEVRTTKKDPFLYTCSIRLRGVSVVVAAGIFYMIIHLDLSLLS